MATQTVANDLATSQKIAKVIAGNGGQSSARGLGGGMSQAAADAAVDSMPERAVAATPVAAKKTAVGAAAGAAPAAAGLGTGLGSVSARVDAILKADSALMKRAATTGMQAVNRRGLGNSSMAVGAAQQAMIDAATPIASQEAKEASDMAMADKTIDANREIAAMNNASAQAIAAGNNASSMDIAKLQAGTQKDLLTLESTLKEKLAAIDRDTQMTIADKQSASQMALAEFTATKNQALAELDASTRLQTTEMSLSANEKLAQLNDATSRWQTQIQADTTLSANEQDNANQMLIATKQIEASAIDTSAKLAAAGQQQLAQGFTDATGNHQQAIANIMANPKLSQSARNVAIASANASYQANLAYLQNLYGVSVSSATPRPAGFGA